MTVRDRVLNAFKESFDLDDETNTSKLVYQELSSLDVDRPHDPGRGAEIEFHTMLETDDISK